MHIHSLAVKWGQQAANKKKNTKKQEQKKTDFDSEATRWQMRKCKRNEALCFASHNTPNAVQFRKKTRKIESKNTADSNATDRKK